MLNRAAWRIAGIESYVDNLTRKLDEANNYISILLQEKIEDAKHRKACQDRLAEVERKLSKVMQSGHVQTPPTES